MKNLRSRVERLERTVGPPSQDVYAAFVDGEGRILDDGSEVIRPWIGRHHRELPDPVTVIGGVDPLVVLGRKPGLSGSSASWQETAHPEPGTCPLPRRRSSRCH